MVDVSAKDVTVREAEASGRIVMASATAQMIRDGASSKGDVLGVARLAAIQSSKLTQLLIPLCHAIPIDAVSVEFDWPDDDSAADGQESLRCRAIVRTAAKTGVEMEAMTAVSIACLTVYDMAKSVDRAMEIGPIRLEAKSGGKSGDFRRENSS